MIPNPPNVTESLNSLDKVNALLSEASDALEAAGDGAFADRDEYFEALRAIAVAGGLVVGEAGHCRRAWVAE